MPRKKPTRKQGKPTLLTPEVQNTIVAAIAGGVPRKHAANRAGIGERTLYDWLALGRDHTRRGKKGSLYSAFSAALKKAEAERLVGSVVRIGKAAQGGGVIDRRTTTTTRADKNGDEITVTKTVEKFARPEWTADAWFLERRHPDEFAGNRREVRELRQQLAAVLKALAAGKLGGTSEASEAVAPKVGGDAKPDAI